jgi:hypothetical protein
MSYTISDKHLRERMKRFLQAAFKINLFQILVILVSGVIKYCINVSGISKQLEGPFLIMAASCFLLFLFATGIGGIIEDKSETLENWAGKHPHSWKHAAVASFVKWGQIIPLVAGYLFFIFMFAPTSFEFLLFIFLGIFISNIVSFFFKKDIQIADNTDSRHTR